MESNDLLVVLAMVIYFVVVLAVGFSYAKRSNSSTDEYFIGGRKVGPWFTALSAEASDMSGYLLMGIFVVMTVLREILFCTMNAKGV